MCFPRAPPHKPLGGDMGFDTSLLKSVLESFVEELAEESAELILERPRFAHAVVVLADEHPGELCQATIIRQLDTTVIEQTSMIVENDYIDEEIQRALRELRESKKILETPRNSMAVDSAIDLTRDETEIQTTHLPTPTQIPAPKKRTVVQFPSMNRGRAVTDL